MRKVKEIAKELNLFLSENHTSKEIDKKINEIALDLVNDTENLIRDRKARTNVSLISILKETNQRWNAVARQCRELKKDGFKNFLITITPEIKDLWDTMREQRT